MSNRLCFAYGSNMDESQMLQRCRRSVPIGVASLAEHRFIINSRGVATIVPDESREVYGVLWNICVDDEESLDEWEAVPRFYVKREMKVVSRTDGPQEALVYVATDTARGSPRHGYLEGIINAARQHGLPEPYIKELEQWLTTDVQDS